MNVYKCKVKKVVDGDTVDLLIDLGFSITIKERVRLYGINTPEIRTRDKEEKKKGVAAKVRLINLIESGELTVETIKDKKGKFGRYLAMLYVDGKNINKTLLDEGHAKEYMK